MKNKVVNDLFDYNNRYIIQDKKKFKFSLDSILLAEFVEKVPKGAIILDMCTGNAPIPLILSTKLENKIVAFEIQENIYNLAVESVKINNLEEQIRIINSDINYIDNYFPGNNFDVITCNPPYFKYNGESLINNNIEKAIARHEIKIDLAKIIQLAANNLNNKGSFYLVHRAERIDEIIYYCLHNNLAVKKIQFIVTKTGEKPQIVLVKAVKNGNNGVQVENFVDISNLKTYKNLFNKE